MPLTQSALQDLRLAATKMNFVERRAFFADMCLKYCQEVQEKPKEYLVGEEQVLNWDYGTSKN